MHLFFVLFLATQSIPEATLPAAASYCETCHSDVKVEFKSSVHSREGFTCTNCHGGDPKASSETAAHSGSFRSLKDRKQIPLACASCHSDSAKMKAYGLPTDQMALYQTSVHGRKLAEGDIHVAVCTDCHGVHQILPPTDPQSPTHYRNIAATCGHCHGDEKLMAGYKLSASIVTDYEGSVHGKAMHEGNKQAPVCTSCHGTHGAAPPGVGDVSIVCGNCHQEERNNFRLSPHQHAMADAGIPECAGCHSNHKILKTSDSLWDSTCKECHATDSVEVRRGHDIQGVILEANDEIRKADQSIQEAARIPLDVSDYQARLEEARTYMVQVLPVGHSLMANEVGDLTRHAKSVAVEIQEEVKKKQEIFQTRRIVLGLVWFYILLTIIIIDQYRRQLQ